MEECRCEMKVQITLHPRWLNPFKENGVGRKEEEIKVKAG